MTAHRTIYKFGDFELDPSESALFRSGNAVQITPKALRLLCILSENQGRVLDKSYLLDRVWGESFVEEGSLTFNIRQLRKILSDEVKHPKYIETVPKRGYRFIASVERSETPSQHISIQPAPTPEVVSGESQSRKRPLWKPWILAITLILAAGAVAAVESWFGIFGPEAGSPKLLSTPFSADRLSTDGNVRFAALSKGGEFMVYVAGNQDENQSLRIRDLSTGQSREFIGATEDKYLGLEVSSDDSRVYFVRIAPTESAAACLFRAKIIGGIPESLGCGMQGWFDISNDGKAISYVRCKNVQDDYCSLYLADENLNNERLLVTRTKPNRITDNAISPDGRSVVFAAGQSVDGSNDFGLFKIDLDTNVESAVVDQKFFNVLAVDWMPDGNSLLATALRVNDDSNIWNVDVNARTATQMKHSHDSFKGVSIDRDGARLVSTIRSADFRIFVHPMDEGAKPVTLGNGWTPRFSSDSRILFASERSGKCAIWSADHDGTDVKHLSSGQDDFPVPSADGSSIYFTSWRSEKIEVWKMQPDGSGAEQLSRKEGGFPIGVSSDGFWVYYISAVNRSLHRVSNDGAIEEQVTEIPMRSATLSPGTSLVAFFDRHSKVPGISLFSLASGERSITIPFPGTAMQGKHLAWSKNGEHVYAILFDPVGKTNEVWRLGINGSPAVKIRDLKIQELGERSSFSVSPDERYFAVATGHWKHDAVLVHGLK